MKACHQYFSLQASPWRWPVRLEEAHRLRSLGGVDNLWSESIVFYNYCCLTPLETSQKVDSTSEQTPLGRVRNTINVHKLGQVFLWPMIYIEMIVIWDTINVHKLGHVFISMTHDIEMIVIWNVFRYTSLFLHILIIDKTPWIEWNMLQSV